MAAKTDRKTPPAPPSESASAPAPPPELHAAEVRAAVERAWALLVQRDYDAAGRAVAKLPESSRHVGAVARLARNLAALRRHRPGVYQQLAGVDPLAAARRFRLQQDRGGFLRLALRTAPDAVNASSDPRAAAAEALRQAAGEPLVLSGLGDGYAVAGLASEFADGADNADGAGGRPVFVVEPDGERAVACLMLHDWSAATSPLRGGAFYWFLGDGAAGAFEEMLVESDRLELPTVNVGEGPARKAVGRALSRARARRAALEQKWRGTAAAYYDGFEPVALTVGLSRRGRALVVGEGEDAEGRPVLDHAAEALGRLGWRTRRLTAGVSHERVTGYAVARSLVEVKPDVVLVIGAGAESLEGVIPEALPVVRWFLDDVAAVGQASGRREFVLAPPGADVARGDGRVIGVPWSTRVPVRPELWECIGPDVMCIARGMAETPGAWVARHGDDEAVHAAGLRLLQLYESGGGVDATPQAAGDGVRLEGCTQAGRGGGAEAARVARAVRPLHRVLHAREALRWVAAAAAELGLGLSIYGEGWEDDAALAAFVRGPLGYGIERERLIRDAKVNLCVELGAAPGPGLLDGLVAGGFYVARRAERAGAGEGEGEGEVRYASEAASLGLIGRGDAERSAAAAPLPRWDETSFHDAASLRRVLTRWVGDAAGRRAVAEAQRESVAHRRSTTAVLRRALAQVGRRLAAEGRAAAGVEVHRAA